MPPLKKKILYIITKSNFGGAQRYVFDLATHLPQDQFETVVALGGEGPLKEKLEAAGIQTFPLPDLERDVSVLKEARAFLNIFRIIKEIKPDIVHLNSSKAGALGALAARLVNIVISLEFIVFRFKSLISNSPLTTKNYKLKTVFTSHGWAFKEKRRPFIKKIIEYISWLTVFLSHHTIVVSSDDREKARRFIFVQQKISVVHNGITKPVFKDRSEARKILSEKINHEISADTILVGTVAELTKNKGLEYAISARALLKQEASGRNIAFDKMVCVIIGGGEARNNLTLFIEREGLKNMVFLAGEYPGAAELLKAFDIFLLPSLKEGLPYALLEAGYAGLPIIATNVGGVSEVIDDMKSGIIVKEKRPKEIADALTFLIEHKEKRKEFSEQILKTIETKYTLERMLKETIAIYKKLR